MNQKSNNRLVISLGDPAGIGIEVTLKALGSKDLSHKIQPLLVGCKRNVETQYLQLKKQGIYPLADPSKIQIRDIPFTDNLNLGEPSIFTGKASFDWLTKATEIVLMEKAKALVTAPIAKHAWQEAGYNFPGQTERLAQLSSCKNPSMLFTAKSPHTSARFNTLLATTHIPFCTIRKTLTAELIMSKLDALLDFCKKFTKHPKLYVAGLNPHAGEKGNLGVEESDFLIPILNNWRLMNPQISLEGPLPPDTCWLSSAQAWIQKSQQNHPDGILALYHDQGLIPTKIIAFDYAVNTTLGLPFIRTSPDHGTAFDIAGKGIANYQSMLSAINTAYELANIDLKKA